MTQSTSTTPPLTKWHELLFSHRSRPSRALHIGFVLPLSPMQQPGSSVVDVVVVKSQSESSSVTSHSQALPRAHAFTLSRLRQFSLWLIVARLGMARQQPGASVVVVEVVVSVQSVSRSPPTTNSQPLRSHMALSPDRGWHLDCVLGLSPRQQPTSTVVSCGSHTASSPTTK